MRLSPTAALCSFVLLAASCPAQEIGVAMASSAGVALVKDARFAAGVQPTLAVGGVAELTGDRGFGAGVALAGDFAWASAVRDLVSYRGTSGARLRLFGSWRDPKTGSVLAFAARAGASAAFRRYTETEVWFVTSGLFLEPLVAVRIPDLPWLDLRAGVPIVLERRADLSIAASVGLSVEAGARLRIGAAPSE
jgi:hypothetical protein